MIAFKRIALVCLSGLLFSACATAQPQSIAVAPDHRRFIQQPSNKPFYVWGFNYDRDYKSRLLEDYWATEWPTVEDDFREMKALGANVVRVHLQLARFMTAPDQPNSDNLDRLDRLCTLAEKLGLYLDLTGCGSYHKQLDPDWYARATEQDRWQAQASFWSAIAKTCAAHPSVFCYDLINEPVVPSTKQTDWLANPPLAGFYYVNFLALDPAGRDQLAILQAWTQKIVTAIRAQDSHHLITIGMLPLTPNYAKAVAPQLDFIATHIYPPARKPDDAVANVKMFDVGKPIVVEETFPLPASIDDVATFITKAKPFAAGFISFYWGKSIPELRASTEVNDKLLLGWLERYRKIMSNDP